MHRPASLVFRPARLQDAPAMAEMSRDLVEAGLPWRYTSVRMRALIRDTDTMALLACDAQHMRGLAVMQFLDEHAHLSLLCVQQAQQRQGLGRRLMDWLEASARVAGIASIVLELRADNLAALSFYERIGFVQTKLVPDYYEGRLAARCMRRQLRAGAPEPS
jgi:ribosomal protein S18 acetylase RimI-like enzyme